MTIDIEKLDKLLVDADKIFLTPEGEKVLVQLLELRDQVETAIDEAKKRLEETGLKISSDFTSIQADKIKVYFRAFGERYKIDPSFIETLPKNLYKTTIKYSAIPEEIEKLMEQSKLPQGIIEAERTKQITFSLKNKEAKSEV